MKVRLMAPDEDFDPEAVGPDLPAGVADMVQDLQLDVLLDAMASGDKLLRAAARTALLTPLVDPDRVRYRQAVLADCLAHPEVARALFQLAGRALDAERAVWWVPRSRPEMVLDRSVRVLAAQTVVIQDLVALVAEHGDELVSPGLRAFVATVRTELDEPFIAEMSDRLALLRRGDGLLVTAALGEDGQVTRPVPRVPQRVGRVFSRPAVRKPNHSFEIPDRDEGGFRVLGELRDRALWRVADAADQAAGHVHDFFEVLRGEMAFYLACLNLVAALHERGAPTCVPAPRPVGDDVLRARGLYDPCLVLREGRAAVPNDVTADGVRLLVVSGANHGGKTTLLRALGVAQVLTGAGMLAPAAELALALTPAIRTHWAREEDTGLAHGKLDEELGRFSELVDELVPGALLLSNESFASTNEAEGSQIALTVVRALVEAGVRLVVVTHLYGLAHELHESRTPPAVFLRAERGENGRRPYRFEVAPPLPTSFARDLFQRELGASVSPRENRAVPAGLPVLTTPRLVLRPWRTEDAAAAFDLYSRWEVARYLGRAPRVLTDPAEAQQRVEGWARFPGPLHGVWAVVPRDGEVPVGSVMTKLLPRSGGGEPSQDTEIGWHLHPDVWHRGYATEAASALLGLAWDQGLAEVFAVTYPQNAASQAVCRRLGMAELGLTDRYYDMTCALFRAARP